MSRFVKNKNNKHNWIVNRILSTSMWGLSFISESAKLSRETSMSSIVLDSNKFVGYSPDSRFLQKRLSL